MGLEQFLKARIFLQCLYIWLAAQLFSEEGASKHAARIRSVSSR